MSSSAQPHPHCHAATNATRPPIVLSPSRGYLDCVVEMTQADVSSLFPPFPIQVAMLKGILAETLSRRRLEAARMRVLNAGLVATKEYIQQVRQSFLPLSFS